MNAKRKWLGVSIALLGLAVAQAAEPSEPARFVIRSTRAAIGEVCRLHGLQLVRELGRPDLFLVAGPEGISAADLLPSVANDPRVAGFERDGKARLPRASHGLGSAGYSVKSGPPAAASSQGWTVLADQAAALLIGVDQAHARKDLGRGVVVALIDTAVDASHPVLKGAIVPGADFTTDQAGGGSGIGLRQSTVTILNKSDAKGDKGTLSQSTVTILNRQSSPPGKLSATDAGDLAGHGTMVAALIRAVAPDARILPLAAFDADGSTSVSAIVRALYYAADAGAKVVNMSFDLDSASPEVRRAVKYASDRGVICVGAAGNDGSDAPVYPAALGRVLGVAATTLDDALAPFSNYGASVDLAAPGVDLLTAFPDERYATASGTSFSAALVSGAVAVLAGERPDLDYTTAAAAVAHSVFVSRQLGGGRLDLPAALDALDGDSRGRR